MPKFTPNSKQVYAGDDLEQDPQESKLKAALKKKAKVSKKPTGFAMELKGFKK